MIVPASQWRTRSWRGLSTIALPAPKVYVHHGATGTPTLATLQAYERYHVDHHGWAALGYSFAITGDGTVYEGRGWGRAGAHTSGSNTTSHGICLVGNWSSGTVPQPMVQALADLVADGHRQGACPLSITGGHRDAIGASTSCPGNAGMDAVRRARALLANSPTTIEDDMPSPKDWDDRDVERMQAIVARTMIVGTDRHLSWFLRRLEALSTLTAGKISELGPLSDDQLDELADALAEAVQGADADRLIDRYVERLKR